MHVHVAYKIYGSHCYQRDIKLTKLYHIGLVEDNFLDEFGHLIIGIQDKVPLASL